jgi:hypothetical protein
LGTHARNGVSGAVVVRSDPGIGKSALLDSATTDLTGITLIRSDGFEAELSLLALLPSRQQTHGCLRDR